MSTILLKNGRIITADENYISDIYIENEKIRTIFQKIDAPAEQVIDAAGKYIIPGGIDAHTHLDMPLGSITSSDNFESGTIAAAFGGTTTILDFPTQEHGQSLTETLDRWHRKAQEKACIDYGFHLIITDPSQAGRPALEKVMEAGVTSIKLFMAYPGTLMLGDSNIFQVMQNAAWLGALVSVHAENGSVIDHLVKLALSEKKTSAVYHALTRPPVLEGEAVNRAIALAELSGATLYIVHLSSEDGLRHVRTAKEKGLPVFTETCPQYLICSLEDMIDSGEDGSAKYVYTPPPREKIHQAALWKGLADRTIQVIATDHCPFNFNGQKNIPGTDFSKIPNGVPGIENRLQLLYEEGVNRGRLNLNRWVEICSTAPARIFGLYPRKGAIAVGSDADLVVWDPEKVHTISAARHHMNVDYNLYEGLKIRGNAETVISRGEIIVKTDLFYGRKGRGRFLKRERFNGEIL